MQSNWNQTLTLVLLRLWLCVCIYINIIKIVNKCVIFWILVHFKWITIVTFHFAAPFECDVWMKIKYKHTLDKHMTWMVSCVSISFVTCTNRFPCRWIHSNAIYSLGMTSFYFLPSTSSFLKYIKITILYDFKNNCIYAYTITFLSRSSISCVFPKKKIRGKTTDFTYIFWNQFWR